MKSLDRQTVTEMDVSERGRGRIYRDVPADVIVENVRVLRDLICTSSHHGTPVEDLPVVLGFVGLFEMRGGDGTSVMTWLNKEKDWIAETLARAASEIDEVQLQWDDRVRTALYEEDRRFPGLGPTEYADHDKEGIIDVVDSLFTHISEWARSEDGDGDGDKGVDNCLKFLMFWIDR